jgi:hypothetical protein
MPHYYYLYYNTYYNTFLSIYKHVHRIQIYTNYIYIKYEFSHYSNLTRGI